MKGKKAIVITQLTEKGSVQSMTLYSTKTEAHNFLCKKVDARKKEPISYSSLCDRLRHLSQNGNIKLTISKVGYKIYYKKIN